MDFSFASLLIFVIFVLPGFIAQRSRQTIFPRSLLPVGTLGEAGSLVFSSVLVHSLLWVTLLLTFDSSVLAALSGYKVDELGAALQHRPWAVIGYVWASLSLGYLLGFIEGWMLLRQPLRNLLLKLGWIKDLLLKIGVTGLLDERPVWFYVLNQAPSNIVYLEVALKESGGYYTGRLVTYAILDDTERNKDFCLMDVYFKQRYDDKYSSVPCSRLLLNFGDVCSLKVSFVE